MGTSAPKCDPLCPEKFDGGGTWRGDTGICDSPMTLGTGQTNTAPPERCDTPCLAQGGPKLRNIYITIWCGAGDGKRHLTAMQKARKRKRSSHQCPPHHKYCELNTWFQNVFLSFLADSKWGGFGSRKETHTHIHTEMNKNTRARTHTHTHTSISVLFSDQPSECPFNAGLQRS